MSKTAAAIIVVSAMVFATIAAVLTIAFTSSDDPTVHYDPAQVTTAPAVPVGDVNGSWSADSDGTTFQADVANGTITIKMVKGDTSLLYWYGSFTGQSMNNQTVISDKLDINEMVMSGADSKTFVIHDGVMTFEFKAMGMTKTVDLSHA